eukprot:6104203-Amphidinium_carterae.1
MFECGRSCFMVSSVLFVAKAVPAFCQMRRQAVLSHRQVWSLASSLSVKHVCNHHAAATRTKAAPLLTLATPSRISTLTTQTQHTPPICRWPQPTTVFIPQKTVSHMCADWLDKPTTSPSPWLRGLLLVSVPADGNYTFTIDLSVNCDDPLTTCRTQRKV